VKKLVVCLVAIAALAVLAPPALAAEASPWQLKNPIGPQRDLRADLKTVCALDGGTAWAAGAGAAVYYTHDGGDSWEAQETGAPWWTEWRAVRFADMRHGLLLGQAAARSLLYRTSDGGRSWRPEVHGMGAVKLRDIDVPTRLADDVAAAGAIGAEAATADPDAAAPERAFTAGDGGAVGALVEGGSAPVNYLYLTATANNMSHVDYYPDPSTWTFTVTDTCVTTGQSYDGWKAGTAAQILEPYYAAQHPYDYVIEFDAGRKDDSSVAAWFNGYCGSIKMNAKYPSFTTPGKLNFAFKATMYCFGRVPPEPWAESIDIAFAQGSHDGHNLWWTGSPTFGWNDTYTKLTTPQWAGSDTWLIEVWDVDNFVWWWMDPWVP
jgi:hypothetical protein